MKLGFLYFNLLETIMKRNMGENISNAKDVEETQI